MALVETLRQDVRFALRGLRRQKAWTAIAVATLALGVGANSALFTIINAVMLRPLPFPEPTRILSISESDKGVDRVVVPSPTIVAWQAAQSFESMAAYGGTSTIIAGAQEAEIVTGARVSQGYFKVFGVAPSRGRTFADDEFAAGAPRTVVLSDQLWRHAFAADTTLVGRTISLDGTATTVVGIMPSSFTSARRAQYWVPMRVSSEQGVTFYYSVIGRLRHGVSVERARSELARLARNAAAPGDASAATNAPVLMSLQDRRYGDTHTALLVLLGAVGVLLLIACTNVANLLLARAARRQREMAVRAALGASRGRLIRYQLVESLLLSTLGGLCALVIPWAATGYLVRIGPATLGRADNVAVDWTVVAFTFAVAVLTGVIFGLVPALSAGRADLRTALVDAGARATATRASRWYRAALVVAELSTALVLLTGAGVLTRSFLTVTAIDPGVEPDRVLLAKVELSYTRYGEATATDPYFARFVEAVRALPQVQRVALADAPPLGGARMSISSKGPDGKQMPRVDVASVSRDYFQALRISVRAGRLFSADDRKNAPPVAVINETMARTMFAGKNPIGQTTAIGAGGHATIVGVVGDVLQRGVEEAPTPMLYVPLEQHETSPYMHLVIKTASAPSAIVPAIRRIARDLDATQPAPTFSTLPQAMSNAIAPRRFSFILLSLFAGLAAVLACVGLYGVMSYLVAERTNEIGIRVALGADQSRVLGLVVGQGMRLTIGGVMLGLAGSFATVRLLRTLVYRVDVYDPWTFAAGAALLIAIAFIACYVPARRATRVDPLTALRGD